MTPTLFVACEYAVHVVAPDGTVTRAGQAVTVILEQIGYRPLARFLAFPPILWAFEIAYKVVAANRPFFARFLFTKEYDETIDDRKPRDPADRSD